MSRKFACHSFNNTPLGDYLVKTYYDDRNMQRGIKEIYYYKKRISISQMKKNQMHGIYLFFN